MSADEFWKDDPQLFVSYRTSFINKKKREMEELDYKCWLQGLYIYNGNGGLIQSLKQLIINLFSSKKDTNEIKPYPAKPYNELDKEKNKTNKLNDTAKEQKYQEFQNSLCYFGSMKQRYVDKLTNKKR